MNNIFLDTSAWVEYLAGTQKGQKIRDLIKDKQIYSTGIIMAELIAKHLRENQPIEIPTTAITTLTTTINFTNKLGIETAKIYNEQRKTNNKFGLIDAHIAAAARETNSSIITCDNDFREIKEAKIIN